MSARFEGEKLDSELHGIQQENPAFVASDCEGDLYSKHPREGRTSNPSNPHHYPATGATEEPASATSDPPGNEEQCSEHVSRTSDNRFTKFVSTSQDGARTCCKLHRITWIIVIIVSALTLYFLYFGYAMYVERLSNESSIRLCWVTCLVVLLLILNLIWRKVGDKASACLRPCMSRLHQHSNKISWIVVTILFTFIIIFVVADAILVAKRPRNLMSAIGIVTYILIFFVFSYSPAHVAWKPVVWGLCLQFVFALIILRWEVGFLVFRWLGDRIREFLAYSNVGAEFVFGPNYRDHNMAFAVMPTVVFFSGVISALFHLGVMQAVIRKISWVMEGLMGTTAGESLNAAGNVFVGMIQASMMIRPLLPHLTRSEIHAVMTGGFATIGGGVMAAYIRMGVPASHLLSASVMSAPAALAMSKLFYPETEVSKTTAKGVENIQMSKKQNIIEAVSAGASASIKLVSNVLSNVIGFLAILAFVNATLTWFGDRAGLDFELTVQIILSYALLPFAYIMGIEWVDCFRVAEWMGIKLILNEFIAYDSFGKAINHTEMWRSHVASNGSWEAGPVGHQITVYNFTNPDIPGSFYNQTVLDHGIISGRTIAITTYALCGFSSIGGIGIQLGGLGAMAPGRKGDIARVAVRAMIAGCVACFMTACIAGLFHQESF